jgi:hypothetical protein
MDRTIPASKMDRLSLTVVTTTTGERIVTTPSLQESLTTDEISE